MTWMHAMVLLAVLPLAAGPSAAKTWRHGNITWTEAGGGTGTCYFQGTVDGSTLAGHCFGQATPVAVSGTIGESGTVAGTLTDPAGTAIGTFSGAISAGSNGAFTVTGTPAGTWEAPAAGP
jgi:hypothetical protein